MFGCCGGVGVVCGEDVCEFFSGSTGESERELYQLTDNGRGGIVVLVGGDADERSLVVLCGFEFGSVLFGCCGLDDERGNV